MYGLYGKSDLGIVGYAIGPWKETHHGKSIIHRKTVTGFTIEGELIFRILDKLRADGVVPVVEAVTAAGAFYSGSVGAFDDYSITSGRVVTGTNPASGRSATERGVKLFDNSELP